MHLGRIVPLFLSEKLYKKTFKIRKFRKNSENIQGWSRGPLWTPQKLENHSTRQGRNWVIFRGGCRYICNRNDEIIHGLSPSVKCVAPLYRDMSLPKVWNSGGGARPLVPPPSCARSPSLVNLISFFNTLGTVLWVVWGPLDLSLF